LSEPQATLSAIVDPSPIGKQLAVDVGVPWYLSLRDMIASDRPDGVSVAKSGSARSQFPRVLKRHLSRIFIRRITVKSSRPVPRILPHAT
jgi:hypothetical protein